MYRSWSGGNGCGIQIVSLGGIDYGGGCGSGASFTKACHRDSNMNENGFIQNFNPNSRVPIFHCLHGPVSYFI